MQVTFKKKGVDCISNYPNRTSSEIAQLLHSSDCREQIAERFRKDIKDKQISEISDITLGYLIEEISKTKFHSRISEIKCHSDNVKFGNISFGR
jgi:hypothetical protein